jgi:hypothetical protein
MYVLFGVKFACLEGGDARQAGWKSKWCHMVHSFQIKFSVAEISQKD